MISKPNNRNLEIVKDQEIGNFVPRILDTRLRMWQSGRKQARTKYCFLLVVIAILRIGLTPI